MTELKPVVGDDGEPDFECGLRTLCAWTGYSDQSLLNFARQGIIKRRGRGKYLLRGSILSVLRQLRERRPEFSYPALLQDLMVRR